MIVERCCRTYMIETNPWVCPIDISYTLDGASHTVGRRKLKPDRRRWSFPQSWYGAWGRGGLWVGKTNMAAAYCYEGTPMRFLASLLICYLVYMRYLWFAHSPLQIDTVYWKSLTECSELWSGKLTLPPPPTKKNRISIIKGKLASNGLHTGSKKAPRNVTALESAPCSPFCLCSRRS